MKAWNVHGEPPSAWPVNSAAMRAAISGRAEVGAGDHRLPADGVEEPAEEQRAEEVPDREDDEEDRDEARGDAPERRVEHPEVERHAVVEERLADEQREAEDRAPRVALEGGLGDLAERDRLALAHRDRLLGLARGARRSPRSTPCSIARTIRSASSSWPWMKSQRGLSGTLRRTKRTPSPRIAPSRNEIRQPTLAESRVLSRAGSRPPSRPRRRPSRSR